MNIVTYAATSGGIVPIGLFVLTLCALRGVGALLKTRPGIRLGRGIVRLSTKPVFQSVVLIALGSCTLLGYVRVTLAGPEPVPGLEQKQKYYAITNSFTAAGVARTDAGSEVFLSSPVWSGGEPGAPEEDRILSSNPALQFHRIRTATPSLDANCHGWVFTGGRYWIDPDEVDRILFENNYAPVTAPRPGDVIVYRSGGGVISHTGIVRLVRENGQVIVESKWGKGGRFLHPADLETYPLPRQYYRTARGSHLLRGLEYPPGEPAPKSARRHPAV